ncbi:MAG: hypothetical protein LBB86_05680, partial [Oscillospiraceae bacterium]|nr:hypothetical protein [Oscillospiraceae bacterium]
MLKKCLAILVALSLVVLLAACSSKVTLLDMFAQWGEMLSGDQGSADDESPKMNDASPEMNDDSPKMNDESPKMNDESPKMNDESSKMNDESP